MKMSVVIPTKNYEEGLVRCLKSVKAQSCKNFEILVVGTEKITEKTAKKFGARFFLDRVKTIGNSYSVGAKNAKGDVVVFIDDDCIAPKNWLAQLKKGLEKDNNLDVLGGEDFVGKNASYFQKVLFQIDLARIYTKAVYGIEARNRLRACNIAYRKHIFKKFDFNRSLISLQEPELHYRLYRSGAKMKFDPNIIVYHERRKNTGAVLRQMYRNGKAKASVMRMHREMIATYDMAILLASVVTIISVFSLVFTDKMFLAWIALLALYFILKPLFILTKTRNIRFYFTLAKVIFAREMAYAAGLVTGLMGATK